MDIQIDDQVRGKVYDKLNQILIRQTEVQLNTKHVNTSFVKLKKISLDN